MLHVSSLNTQIPIERNFGCALTHEYYESLIIDDCILIRAEANISIIVFMISLIIGHIYHKNGKGGFDSLIIFFKGMIKKHEMV